MILHPGTVLKHKLAPGNRNRELFGATVRVIAVRDNECTWEVIAAPNYDAPHGYWRPGRQWSESLDDMELWFEAVSESLFRRPRP